MSEQEEKKTKNEISKLHEIHEVIDVDALMSSGAIPSVFNTPERIMTVVQLGKELGIPPITALNNISLIHGKVVISSTIMLSLLENHGIEYEFTKDFETQEDGKIMTQIKFTYFSKILNSFKEKIFTTTWQELALAGLTDSPMYKKYPKVMLRARCIAFAIRRDFPKVLLGMHTDEEIVADNKSIIADVDEDGKITIIESEAQDAEVVED